MVFAFEAAVEQARSGPSFRDCPLDAVFIDFDPRQAIAKLAIDALDPQIRRLVAVTVRRDHQVLVGVVGPRGAFPSGMAGSFQSPAVGFVDFVLDDICA